MLDLSESYITFLEGSIFNLPQLNYLDLSGNKLISLSQEIVSPLKNLKILNMKNNILTCNKEMINLIKFLQLKKVRYDEDPCKQTETKFEKIVMETSEAPNIENNFWIIEDNHETHNETNVKQIPCQTIQETSSMVNLSELPYSLFIITVLVYGILIGLVCGCGIKSCKMRHKMRQYKGKSTVRLKRIKHLDNETQQLTFNTSELGISTPILIRK